MSEKISFVLDATVKGTKDIVSTTTATERLTAALEEQRGEVQSLGAQLKDIKGFESAGGRAEKLAKQLDDTKASMNALGIELVENKQKTTQLRGEYSQTQAEIRGLNTQMKKASGEGAQKLQVKLKAANERLESLNVEIHQGKAKTNELAVAYKNASGKVDKLTDRQTKQQGRLQSLGDALKHAGISTDRLGDEQKRLEALTEKSTAALEKQNKRLKEMKSIQGRIDARDAKLSDLGGQATSLAVAAAPIAGSMWTAMKDETAYAGFAKASKLSLEAMAELRSWARDSGTPMSAIEMYSMLEAGAQSGIDDKQALQDFAINSAKIGVAFDIDAQDAGKTLSVFKSSLGLDMNGAVGLAGLANHLSNNTNSKAADIAEVIAREGASARAAGFKDNETAALSSAFLSTGMEKERAATAVKNISGRLSLGTAASGTQKKSLARLGFDSQELAAEMQHDASGTLIRVLEAINNAPLEEQSSLISQIFGEEVKGGVSSLAGNTKNFTDALKLARLEQDVYKDSLEQEFKTRMGTSENQLNMFLNKLNRLSVVVGTALLPSLNWVLEPLGKGVDLLGDFAEANQDVTAAVGIGAAAFIGLKGVLIAGKAASLIFGNSMDKTRLFRKGLNRETQEGGRIAAMAAKRWRSLNQAVVSSHGPRSDKGLGAEVSDRSQRRRRKRRGRGRSRGLAGLARSVIENRFIEPKGAALAMAGSGLAMMPMSAMAADAIEIGGDVAETAGKFGLARVLKPLGLAMNAMDAVEGVATGDMEQTGEALGDIGGSMGGGALGAAIGTMILPGIGTAIGGLLGSIGGGMGGEMIGGWFGRKLDSPEQMAAKIDAVQKKEAQIRQQPNATFNMTINAAQGQDAEQIAEQAMLKIEQRFANIMGENTLTTQMGYAAIDRDS